MILILRQRAVGWKDAKTTSLGGSKGKAGDGYVSVVVPEDGSSRLHQMMREYARGNGGLHHPIFKNETKGIERAAAPDLSGTGEVGAQAAGQRRVWAPQEEGGEAEKGFARMAGFGKKQGGSG